MHPIYGYTDILDLQNICNRLYNVINVIVICNSKMFLFYQVLAIFSLLIFGFGLVFALVMDNSVSIRSVTVIPVET